MSDLVERRWEVRQRLIDENEFPNIPDNWGVERLRFLFTESKERNGTSPVGEMLSVSEYRGVVPRKYEHEEQKRTDAELENYRVVRPGQLAVNSMWLNHLGLGVSEHTGHVSPAYNVYNISDRLDRRFVHHLVRSNYYLKIYLRYLYGIRPNSFQIKSNDWSSIPIIVPDLATQRQIADFLDRETTRIDQLIEKKQRLVVLLGEKRQSDIVRAVTHGLESNVDLKITGVSWVPRIPSHWELRKIKHLGKPIIGLTYAPDDLVSEGEGTPVLRANNIQSGKLQPENLVHVASVVPQKLKLRLGDILICSRNGSRNLIGKNAVVTSEFVGKTFGAFNTVLRSKHSDFLYWVLQSPIFDHQAGSFLTSTINQLTISTLSNLVVPFAPPPEQDSICSYLHARERIFDVSNKKLKTSIDRLKEYRTTLITAAVTGQIDVQTYAKSGTPDRHLDAIQEDIEV